VWRDGSGLAANKTNLVLANTSTFTTLAELLACIERTFGDLDGERMAHPKMTPGMMANEYTAKFKQGLVSMRRPWRMLSSEGFEAQSILFKVYSQTVSIDNWKTVVHNLD